MEKELTAIVMVLKEFRSMLLGADLKIYNDRRNLIFANVNTQRVVCFEELFGRILPRSFLSARQI